MSTENAKPVDGAAFNAMFADRVANRERIAETLFVIATLAVSRLRLPEQDFDDMVSTAMVKAMEKLHTYEAARNSAFAYFYSVCSRAVLDVLRKQTSRREVQFVDNLNEEPTVDDDTEDEGNVGGIVVKFSGGQYAWNFVSLPKHCRINAARSDRDGGLYVSCSAIKPRNPRR